MKKIHSEITKVAILSLVLPTLVSSFPTSASAQASVQISAAGSPDAIATEKEIKSRIADLGSALAGAESKAVTDLWTADGSYIDGDGVVSTGKEALDKRFASIFQKSGKVLVTMVPEHFQQLSPDVVTSEGVVIPQGRFIPDTRYTMVLVKRDGKWLIANATETPLSSQASIHPLNSLDWLIGEWVTDKNGATVKMKADWTGNKNFILCRYEITRPGQEPQVDNQIVGWDPQREEIASWSFGANGSYGRGHWNKKDNRWLVDSEGVEPDGKAIRAVNVISMTDANNFSWQSTDRSAGGISLPDTETLKVQRLVK